MNLSFTTELDPNLAESFAFFSQCCSKVASLPYDEPLLEPNFSSNDQTIFVLPPQCDLKEEDFWAGETNSPTEGFVFVKNSAFLYSGRKNTFAFPRLKLELGLEDDISIGLCSQGNLAPNEAINDRQESYGSQMNALDANKADTQSVSSASNTQIRKVKMPNTPIGVRTKAEKSEEQKVRNFHL